MEHVPGRKSRSLVIESLEGRPLLSMMGRPPGWTGGASEFGRPPDQNTSWFAASGQSQTPGAGMSQGASEGQASTAGGSGSQTAGVCAPTAQAPSNRVASSSPTPQQQTADLLPAAPPANASNAAASNPTMTMHPADHEAPPASAPPNNAPPRNSDAQNIAPTLGMQTTTSTGPVIRTPTIVVAFRPTAEPAAAPRASTSVPHADADAAVPDQVAAAVSGSVEIAAATDAAAAGSAHGGPITIGPLVQGLIVGMLGITAPVSRDTRSFDEPIAADDARVTADVATASTTGAVAAEHGTFPQADDASVMPAPQVADLITVFLPSSRASVESAIDRFLDPFEEIAGARFELEGSIGLIPASLAVAVSVVALDVALRVRQPKGRPMGIDRDAVGLPFPGLPGLWRWTHR